MKLIQACHTGHGKGIPTSAARLRPRWFPPHTPGSGWGYFRGVSPSAPGASCPDQPPDALPLWLQASLQSTHKGVMFSQRKLKMSLPVSCTEKKLSVGKTVMQASW